MKKFSFLYVMIVIVMLLIFVAIVRGSGEESSVVPADFYKTDNVEAPNVIDSLEEEECNMLKTLSEALCGSNGVFSNSSSSSTDDDRNDTSTVPSVTDIAEMKSLLKEIEVLERQKASLESEHSLIVDGSTIEDETKGASGQADTSKSIILVISACIMMAFFATYAGAVISSSSKNKHEKYDNVSSQYQSCERKEGKDYSNYRSTAVRVQLANDNSTFLVDRINRIRYRLDHLCTHVLAMFPDCSERLNVFGTTSSLNEDCDEDVAVKKFKLYAYLYGEDSSTVSPEDRMRYDIVAFINSEADLVRLEARTVSILLQRINPAAAIDTLLVDGTRALILSTLLSIENGVNSKIHENEVHDRGDDTKVSLCDIYMSDAIATVHEAISEIGEAQFSLDSYWKRPAAPDGSIDEQRLRIYEAVAMTFLKYLSKMTGTPGMTAFAVAFHSDNEDAAIAMALRTRNNTDIDSTPDFFIDGWKKWIAASKDDRYRMGLTVFIYTLLSENMLLYWPSVGVVCLGFMLESLYIIFNSYVFGQLFESVAVRTPISRIYNLTAATFGAFALTVAMALWAGAVASRLSIRVLSNLRRSIYRRINSVSPSFFQEHTSSDIVQRFTQDLKSVEDSIVSVLPTAFFALSLALAAAVSCFIFEWRLMLGLLFFAFFLQTIPYFLSGPGLKWAFNKRQGDSRLVSIIKECIEGYMVNQAYGLKEYWTVRFENEQSDYFSSGWRGLYWPALVHYIQRQLPVFLMAVAILALTLMMRGGHVTLGNGMSFFNLLVQVVGGISMFASVIPLVMQASVGYGRILALLRTHRHEISEPDVPRDLLEPERPGIELSKVSFRYRSGHWALRDVTLSIATGESVSFVGVSGSGKSTIMNLILRLYDATEGSVCVGGVDVKELSSETLSNVFGVVLQNNFLYQRSLRENIRFGCLQATDEEVETAAHQAEIHEFITSLRCGYDTIIGERGMTLSGGQRQRIALARMLVRKPRVLILDEVTSSLDAATERKILDTIRRITAGRTVITVTHRLVQAAASDRIFFMSGGHVEETGTHSDLLRKNGGYAKLWKKHQEAHGPH